MSKGTRNSTQTFQTDFTLRNIKASWLSACFLAAAMLFLAGCQDGIGSVGQEVLPPTDQINTFFADDLELEFSSKAVDSVNSYRQIRDLFGNYVDPQFGRMTASFFSEFNPSLTTSFNGLSSNDLVFDSVILKIAITASYGRPESPQILQVFELQDTLPTEAIADNDGLPVKGPELSNDFQFTVDGNTGEAQLSVRLSDELGTRLLFADSSDLNNDDAFAQLFPGLAISTQPVNFFSREPGAIYQVFSTGGNTEIELFYKKRDENSQAFFSESAVFGISGSTKRLFSLRREDTEGTVFESNFLDKDSANFYEFIQGVSLIENTVKFPDLPKLGNVLSNRAVLTLQVVPEFLGSNDRFTPPEDLEVYVADAEGNISFNDDSVARLAVDGLVSYSSSSNSYEIILTEYVNQVILGQEENNGLVIRPVFSNVVVNRAIFGGLAHPDYAPKFEVFYINFPN
ncbi:MAG: DUF4270 domain-containing protein [Bacteroidia bacterium]|nr:DUF4270 domain-containing protein [Bacteroidia bacterium]